MIWFVSIAAAIAIGILIMMYDEISTGFYRWRDYGITTVVLYGVGLILFILASLVSLPSGFWGLLAAPLKALLIFGLMVMVWGGTLTLGSLIIKLLSSQKRG